MSVTPSSTTIVGLFRDRSMAEQAVEALNNAGFTSDTVRFASPGSTGSFFGDLKSLFAGPNAGTGANTLSQDLNDLGLSDDDVRYYSDEYNNGNTVVAVQAPGREHDVLSILHQYGAHNARTRTGLPDASVDQAPAAYTTDQQPATDYSPADQQPAAYTPPTDTVPATDYQPADQSTSVPSDVPAPAPVTPPDDSLLQASTDAQSYQAVPATAEADTAAEAAPADASVAQPASDDQSAPAANPADSDTPFNAVPAGYYVETQVPPTSDDTQSDAAQADQTPSSDYNTQPDLQPVDQTTSSDYTTQPDLTRTTEKQRSDYDTQPDLTQIDQPVDAASTNGSVVPTPTPDSVTPATATQQNTAASDLDDRYQKLQGHLQDLQQQLQDAKTRLESARQREQQLQSIRQQITDTQSELQSTLDELHETESRISQHFNQ